MKLPGMKIGSSLLGLTKQLDHERVEQFNDIETEAIIRINTAYLDFHSRYHEKFPGRPFLVFMGDCIEVRGNLPYGISSMPLYNENIVKSNICYEFSDDELSVMAKQGLFHRGFEVPQDFIGAEINVPVKCSLTVIKPEMENGIPLAFVDIHNNCAIEMDTEHSDWAFGYEFDDLVKDEYDFTDEFVDDKSFDEIFGKEEKEIQEEKEEKTPVDEAHLNKIRELRQKAKLREERIEKDFEEKVKEEKELVAEEPTEEKEDTFDESEFMDSSEFDDLFGDVISSSEKDAEDTRQNVQKIDRAEDLQEENEKDDYVRRPADSTGISKSDGEHQLGD